MASDNTGAIFKLSESIGASEPAVRLIISLFLGIPIAFLHRYALHGKSTTLQHVYFVCCGLFVGYFNFGNDIVHAVITIFVSYLLLILLRPGRNSLIAVFIFTMSYLLTGYWTTATEDYDIIWTMPHCVLTLRLIGLAFNLFDGTFPDDKLSAENRLVALREMPSILEVFAHALFPTTFLVGPQTTMRRYKDFVELRLEQKTERRELPDSIKAGLFRTAQGILYLVLHQVGALIVSDEYILSEEYRSNPFWLRMLKLGLWGKVTLYKYMACWLITESACIYLGYSYNGVDSEGNKMWNGCSNVKLKVFEGATKMDHYIDSFNVNTNSWCAQYIYKRLKFLNNRTLSQLGVLIFLAVWHGFHTGYYYTFFLEFIIIYTEKVLIKMFVDNGVLVDVFFSPQLKYFTYVLLRVYTFIGMGYAMVPFSLFTFENYYSVHKANYFVITITFTVLAFVTPYLRKFVFKPRRTEKTE